MPKLSKKKLNPLRTASSRFIGWSFLFYGSCSPQCLRGGMFDSEEKSQKTCHFRLKSEEKARSAKWPNLVPESSYPQSVKAPVPPSCVLARPVKLLHCCWNGGCCRRRRPLAFQ